MLGLNEQQLQVMRQTYTGFKEKDETIKRVREDVKRYRGMKESGPVYIPVLEKERLVQQS